MYKPIEVVAVITFYYFLNQKLPAFTKDAAFAPPLFVLVFVNAYFLSDLCFKIEIENRTIWSLLASPLSLKDIILGKLLTIFLVLCTVEIVGFASIWVFGWINEFQVPSSTVVIIIFLVLTTWGMGFTELFAIIFMSMGNIKLVPFLFFLLYIAIARPDTLQLMARLFGQPKTLWIITILGIAFVLSMYFVMTKLDKEKVAQVLE